MIGIAGALLLLAACQDTIKPPEPATLEKLTNPTVGVAGTDVTPAPSVRVADYAGRSIVGRVVTFTVTAGGGSVTGASVISNQFGEATVGSWRLGPGGGVTNTLTATAGRVTTTFSVTSQ